MRFRSALRRCASKSKCPAPNAPRTSKAERGSSSPIRNGVRMEIGRRRQALDEQLERKPDRSTGVVTGVVGRREPFNVPMWRKMVFETGRNVVVGSRRDLARIEGLVRE